MYTDRKQCHKRDTIEDDPTLLNTDDFFIKIILRDIAEATIPTSIVTITANAGNSAGASWYRLETPKLKIATKIQ